MSKVIYETRDFLVELPTRPHVPRIDGGHIMITTKEKVDSRLELTPSHAIEAMYLSMIFSESMKKVLRKKGVDIQRINYQENGNWAFIRNEKPYFHIHIYGRTIDAKSQKWGEALYFPDPSTGFYNNFTGLTDEDVKEIIDEVNNLKNTEKYNLINWKIAG